MIVPSAFSPARWPDGGVAHEWRVLPVMNPAALRSAASRLLLTIEQPSARVVAPYGGVAAQIVTGPHEAHRQDPHLRFDMTLVGRARSSD